MAMPDVTVVGAGIFGLSVAYSCARRGARVRVVERHRIGAGASGGPVGALAPHVPENWNEKKAFQLDSLLASESHWREVEAQSGLPTGYARHGRIQPLADERAVELARSRVTSAQKLWKGAARWEVTSDGSLGDWQPRSPTGLFVRDTLTARIDPLGACLALAWATRSCGGEISYKPGPLAGRVVWATGWEGLADLSSRLGRDVGNGVKGQALALRYDAVDAPQIFTDGLHIVPHNNRTVAVGSTSERAFDDPDGVDRQLEDLRVRAIKACPALAQAEVVWRWAGVRPRAKTRSPILGAWPGRKDHFVANGAFKIGFGIAPKVGEVMADLILEGQDGIPQAFRLD